MDILTLFQILLVCVLCGTASPIADRNQSEGFSKAAERLVRRLKLPESRLQEVPRLLKDIEQTLGTHWPGCRAINFGSTVTGLALTQSDVDTFIKLNSTDIDTSTGAIVEEAKTVLEQYPTLFTDFRTLPNAPVPIVSFRHIPTGFNVDVNFKNELSSRMSQLLRYLLHIDDRVLDLAIIIKHWAQLHKITEMKRFPSSGMTMLLVFYLQQAEVLPPVVLLQKNAEPYIIGDWNAGFEEIKYSSRSNLSMYELLGGFFEYYINFDFEQSIVSPFVGYPIKRKVFKVLENVPQEFYLYKRNVELNLTQPLSCGHTCIQDPFFHSQNYITRPHAVLKSERIFMIQLKHAVLKYRESNGCEFLDQILTLKTEYIM